MMKGFLGCILQKFMHIVAGMLQFTKVYKQRRVRSVDLHGPDWYL